MSADPLARAVEAVRAIMAGLGDDPPKALLDKAWADLDQLWQGAQPGDPVRHLLREEYETLAMIYAAQGLEAPA